MNPVRYFSGLVRHRYGLSFAAYILSAFVTGVACVAFMKAFSFADSHRLDFARVGWWTLAVVPALFLAAVLIVKLFAPYAAGSGIPQAIYVIRRGSSPQDSETVAAMTSPKTLAVKVVSIVLAVWAGASIGREGPTVQIAVCMMFLCMTLIAKFVPVDCNPRSIALAGGAAGLAAAFNTPLAGVTFAIEELSNGYFENIKDYVLMAIIVAALSAKALTGEYVYFGKLPDPPDIGLSAIILVSVAAGLAGYLFSSVLLRGTAWFGQLAARGYYRYAVPAGCALLLLGVAYLGGNYVLGPGNGAAQNYLAHGVATVSDVFPAAKFLSTVVTYCSGVAGGIFAPSLSMGAGIGAEIARLLEYPVSSCALVGMSAFMCGAILSPMTAFVIVFELTGNHSMLLPIMLGSLISYIVVKSLGGKSLYSQFADRYMRKPQA